LLATSKIVLIGMDGVLGPLREALLERSKTIIVPHRTKAGSYWRVTDVPKAAAKLPNLPIYGQATSSLDDVQVAVLASVIVTESGGRLSKGYGWGSAGPPVRTPALTLAHPLMVFKSLEIEMESHVVGFATPEKLFVL
jgi:5-formyltetrahydrofolate cyclo-ligase